MGRRLPWQHPELRVSYTVPQPAPKPTTAPGPSGTQNFVMRSSKRSAGRHRLYQNASTPSRHQRSSTARTPGSQVQRLKGLFSNGTWHCDCDPRQEARLLTVKKDSPNKGRLFWKCDQNKCDFFLWEDEAQARSGGHVSITVENNAPPDTPSKTPATRAPASTARPEATQMPTPSTRATSTKTARTKPISDFFSKTQASSSTPGKQRAVFVDSSGEDEAQDRTSATDARFASSSSHTLSEGTPSASSNKRKHGEFVEDLMEDMSSDEERLLNEVVDRSARKLIPAPDAWDTPTAPRTDTARKLFTDDKRVKFDDRGTTTTTPGSSSQPRREPDITAEVMGLLRGQFLEDSVKAAVRQALDRHDAHLRGAIKGRDAVRTQLKKRDDRIATLQEKVTALENKTRMQKEELTSIKAGLADLYTKH